MNLVGQLAQLALDPVGEIDGALHVAIADGQCDQARQVSLRGDLCQRRG
jgi:hypothetical protein